MGASPSFWQNCIFLRILYSVLSSACASELVDYGWDYILDEMNPKEVSLDTTLTDLFVNPFRKPKVLEHDFHQYKQLTHDDPNMSYQWLRGRIEVYLDEDLSERNKKAQLKAHEDKAKGHCPIFAGFGSKRVAAQAVEGEGPAGKGGGQTKGKLDELPRGHEPARRKGSDAPGVTAGGVTEADVRKLDSYFFHVKGHCNFGKLNL